MEKSFCLLPFTTLNIHPDGKVSVCRNKGIHFTVGDLKEKSLKEIWQGEKLQRWREEFLTGNIQTCKWEMENLSCHLCTLGNSLQNVAQVSLTPEHILRFGANFNGECNLRCRMCDVWTQQNGFYKESWEDFEKNLFPHLEILDLFSGEPFIQEDTFRLAELMKRVNPKCRWFITTNGQWDFTPRIEQLLESLNLEHLAFSLESLDEKQYAEIRRGGTLSRLLENCEKLSSFFKQRAKTPKLSFNFLVMKDNYEQVPLVYEYAKKLGFSVSLIIEQKPEEYSLLNLSLEKRREALEFLYEKLKDSKGEGLRVLKGLLHSLPTTEKKKFFLKKLSP